MRLKDALIGKLDDDELSRLKTAFDVVGSIAILEIDDELKAKEKLIAETLLSLHKNITTVLKKADEHSGEFRTQKMKWLAGEKTKETIHKETNTRLKLDVEKVYFSARLSTERKRVMEQVRQGEDVLVMFSGCAPYPCVIGKNSGARRIVGIEINPVGHKYALENIRLNKLRNVELYNSDVRKIVPRLIERPVVGLKSNWRKDHLPSRLKEKPEILEIYLGNGDLENHLDDIYHTIRELTGKIKDNADKRVDKKAADVNRSLKEKGSKDNKSGQACDVSGIMVHMPLMYKGMEVNMCTTSKKRTQNTIECFTILEKMCRELDLLGFIAHPYSFHQDKQKELFGKTYKNSLLHLNRFLKHNKYKHMWIENMPWPPFSDAKAVEGVLAKHRVRLCLDIPHMYLSARNEDAFYSGVRLLSERQPYFHIADCKYLNAEGELGEKHSSPIGEGKIDLTKILPYIRKGVIEVISKDETHPREMLGSYMKFKGMAGQMASFDRIIMPLPKSAEDFLPTALSAARKGTIIHFYDFLHESEFHRAEEKVRDACKKAGFSYKALDFVRCGQHSPRTYRICLDFMITA